MVKKNKMSFRKGAASFYMVAFSTLILVIIVASFAAIIISAVIRASNDDLSQSAYDSALAGIEDAKLAYYNYRACIEQGAVSAVSKPTGDGPLTCSEIIWYMEHPDCDMVAHILGRIGKDESSADTGGVMIQETSSGKNNMQQAYTCVKIETKLSDIKTTLTETNPMRVVRVKLVDTEADKIKEVVVGWSAREGGTAFTNIRNNLVKFANGSNVAIPPVLAVGLVQTSENFALDQFDRVVNINGESGTDRGTVFLVPTDNLEMAKTSKTDNYKGIYDSTTGKNIVSSDEIVKSNDRTVKNVPYVAYCDDDGCAATMKLPSVIYDYASNKRNDDTFMFVLSIPYGGPQTDITLRFYCDKTDTACGEIVVNGTTEGSNQAMLEGVQVNIDSTGRANNLYRRIEARLDPTDVNFPQLLYAVELLDEGANKLLDKNIPVTSEYSDWDYGYNLDKLRAK